MRNVPMIFLLAALLTTTLHPATIDIAKKDVPLCLALELKKLSYTIDAYGNIVIDIKKKNQRDSHQCF